MKSRGNQRATKLTGSSGNQVALVGTKPEYYAYTCVNHVMVTTYILICRSRQIHMRILTLV